MTARSERRQYAGEDFEAEVLFVAEPVGATLEHTDLVVQPLDEAERDLVLRAAVGRDPLPVPLNHRGELLVGPQALPLERRPPVLEEAARPALAPVVPELPERFLEQVRGVQPLLAASSVVSARRPLRVRFSRCASKVYFCPLMNRRCRPDTRAYSLLRTWSSASPRWRTTWNLSNRMLACGAWRAVETRNGFHMSMTASRIRVAFRGPSHA